METIPPSLELRESSSDSEKTASVFEELKKQLECDKLRLEIADFNKPWFKRTPYLAILIPTIVALAGAIQGWRSGYFDVQAKLQEVRQRELKLQEQTIGDKEKDQAKRAADLAQRDNDLTQRGKFVDKKEGEIEDREAKLQEKLAEQSRVYENKLELVQRDYSKQLQKIEEKSRHVVFDSALATIQRDKSPTRYSSGFNELVGAVRSSDDHAYVAKVLSGELAKTDLSEWHRSVYSFLMYLATKDPKWRDTLLSRATDAEKSSTDQGFGCQNAGGTFAGITHDWWPAGDREIVLSRISGMVGSKCFRYSVLQTTYELINFPGDFDLTTYRTTHRDEYFAVLLAARDDYRHAYPGALIEAHDAHLALEKLAPQCYLAVAATFMSRDPKELGVNRADLFRDLGFVYSGPIQLERSKYPLDTNAQEWEQWTQAPENTPTIAMCLERGLTTLKNDEKKFAEMLQKWTRNSAQPIQTVAH